ncbi:protein phosphatase CheZ [Betaproteobacteria bacterium SCN1]|jgi:chemotaxis protein CheZ|nr:protein phosphatase CheZ [Betaproteobacteria bacterium SCN1]MBN8761495.1 protein phosphatase CheZ [Thiobacillus sp.]ODU89140.1 MAG: protein phosphatase CheZ [Thiobacillus sp. SCN 65-179]OJW34452.1 MAG: protein phosphatase CheZ [Thiobacillus sp. 65-69]
MESPFVSAIAEVVTNAVAVPGECSQEAMLARVGQITRALHDRLRELGFDKVLEKATVEMPDVRDRLNYVARMTEQAAQRVLNATDSAIPLQERIDAGASEVLGGWQRVMAEPFSESNYRDMATLTMQCLADMRNDTGATKQHLLDIMMAQDFQDLTGQVIRKVTDLAHELEQQLVQFLVDYAPNDTKREQQSSLLNGPQINPANRSDVVADQGQVDDLLESLGF